MGEEISHTRNITEDLHNQFMILSGDNSPIHSSLEFARHFGYKERLGYCFLITAIISEIYGTIFPGGSELCLKQDCNFPNPYYVNDDINFKVKVINKNESLRLLTVMTEAENQEKKLVFKGTAVFQLSLVKNNESL